MVTIFNFNIRNFSCCVLEIIVVQLMTTCKFNVEFRQLLLPLWSNYVVNGDRDSVGINKLIGSEVIQEVANSARKVIKIH